MLTSLDQWDLGEILFCWGVSVHKCLSLAMLSFVRSRLNVPYVIAGDGLRQERQMEMIIVVVVARCFRGPNNSSTRASSSYVRTSIKWASRQAAPVRGAHDESGGRPCLPFGYCRHSSLLQRVVIAQRCFILLEGSHQSSQHGTNSGVSHSKAAATLQL